MSPMDAALLPTRQIKVIAWQWGYNPSYISVKAGQKIKFIASSLDVAHTLTNDELGINIKISPRGAAPAEYEFTVPKAGDFVFRCDAPCGPAKSKQTMRMVAI